MFAMRREDCWTLDLSQRGRAEGTAIGVPSLVRFATRVVNPNGAWRETGIKWRHEGCEFPKFGSGSGALVVGRAGCADGGVCGDGANFRRAGEAEKQHDGDGAQENEHGVHNSEQGDREEGNDAGWA